MFELLKCKNFAVAQNVSIFGVRFIFFKSQKIIQSAYPDSSNTGYTKIRFYRNDISIKSSNVKLKHQRRL
jgi:hypothetical protein